MCPCCCCYWRAASETSALGGVVQLKRMCLAAYLISAARERGSGMNRIGHPDWVKLCVVLNWAPNQDTFCNRINGLSCMISIWWSKVSYSHQVRKVLFFVKKWHSIRDIHVKLKFKKWRAEVRWIRMKKEEIFNSVKTRFLTIVHIGLGG